MWAALDRTDYDRCDVKIVGRILPIEDRDVRRFRIVVGEANSRYRGERRNQPVRAMAKYSDDRLLSIG